MSGWSQIFGGKLWRWWWRLKWWWLGAEKKFFGHSGHLELDLTPSCTPHTQPDLQPNVYGFTITTTTITTTTTISITTTASIIIIKECGCCWQLATILPKASDCNKCQLLFAQRWSWKSNLFIQSLRLCICSVRLLMVSNSLNLNQFLQKAATQQCPGWTIGFKAWQSAAAQNGVYRGWK